MKIRTTNTGWLFLIGFIVFTALALTTNGFSTHFQLYPQQGHGRPGAGPRRRRRRPALPRAWPRSPPA